MIKPYANTQVHWGKSQAKIISMLEEKGSTGIGVVKIDGKLTLAFRMPYPPDKSIDIKFTIPLSLKEDNSKNEKELNRLYRILYHHLRAKLIAIDSGLVEFIDEFLANVVVCDKQGRAVTIGEIAKPQIVNQIESGKQKPIALLE